MGSQDEGCLKLIETPHRMPEIELVALRHVERSRLIVGNFPE